MPNVIKWICGLFLATLAACSCGDIESHGTALKQWMLPNGKIKVLSSIAMIDDLIKQVGGDFVDSTVLIKGELDPHSYQLVKGDDKKFAFADLIFFNGLGLEHGPSLQSYLGENSKTVVLGDKIMNESPNLVLLYKGQKDPHIWLDLELWSKALPFIVEALSKKDPAHAEQYATNAATLTKDLKAAHQQVKAILDEVPSAKRYLVTSHDAFSYFTRAYLAAPGEAESVWRLRFVSPEGLAPESQISTTDIQAIIDHLSRFNIEVLFPESNVNKDSIRKIVHAAQQKGLNVKIADVSLYADAMGKPGSEGDTYIKMIIYNGKAIASHLKDSGK